MRSRARILLTVLLPATIVSAPADAFADQLFTGGRWASTASDDKAQAVGDIVTVLIFEAASASNQVRNRSSKETNWSGEVSAGSINEGANLRFGGSYAGSGEVARTDRLAATMAAQVVGILANGDLLLEGSQNIDINGEARVIAVRGQVRRIDVSTDNTVPSSRLANAQINYDGEGFVTRSAKPGIINQIFSFLGIG